MRILILAVGKLKDQGLRQKIEDYFKKLGKGMEILVQEIPAGKARLKEDLKKQEAERILAQIPARNFVVALDERGTELNSQQFADLIQKLMEQGKNLVLIIGGAYGLDQSVRERANLVMALSRLTFSHELARLILA